MRASDIRLESVGLDNIGLYQIRLDLVRLGRIGVWNDICGAFGAAGGPHFHQYRPGGPEKSNGLLQNREIYLIRTNSAPNGWGMVAGKTGWLVLSGY